MNTADLLPQNWLKRERLCTYLDEEELWMRGSNGCKNAPANATLNFVQRRFRWRIPTQGRSSAARALLLVFGRGTRPNLYFRNPTSRVVLKCVSSVSTVISILER